MRVKIAIMDDNEQCSNISEYEELRLRSELMLSDLNMAKNYINTVQRVVTTVSNVQKYSEIAIYDYNMILQAAVGNIFILLNNVLQPGSSISMIKIINKMEDCIKKKYKYVIQNVIQDAKNKVQIDFKSEAIEYLKTKLSNQRLKSIKGVDENKHKISCIMSKVHDTRFSSLCNTLQIDELLIMIKAASTILINTDLECIRILRSDEYVHLGWNRFLDKYIYNKEQDYDLVSSLQCIDKYINIMDECAIIVYWICHAYQDMLDAEQVQDKIVLLIGQYSYLEYCEHCSEQSYLHNLRHIKYNMSEYNSRYIFQKL